MDVIEVVRVWVHVCGCSGICFCQPLLLRARSDPAATELEGKPTKQANDVVIC